MPHLLQIRSNGQLTLRHRFAGRQMCRRGIPLRYTLMKMASFAWFPGRNGAITALLLDKRWQEGEREADEDLRAAGIRISMTLPRCSKNWIPKTNDLQTHCAFQESLSFPPKHIREKTVRAFQPVSGKPCPPVISREENSRPYGHLGRPD